MTQINLVDKMLRQCVAQLNLLDLHVGTVEDDAAGSQELLPVGG